MSPDEELALVRQALTSGITGCVEWHPGEGERIRKSRWLQGLTPEGIQRDIVEFVSRGGAVKQMKERRPEYSHRKFWYRCFESDCSWKWSFLILTPIAPLCFFSTHMNRNSKEKPFPRKCPQCKEPAVRPRVMTYHAEVDYDGRAYEFDVPELRVPKCSKCHTHLLDADANEQISAAFRGFMKLLTPAQIRKNREALGWTQKQLAANLSIAEATVSRWENGGQIQQRSLDKFMRIVFGFPNVRRALLDDEFLSQVGLNPGVTQEPEHAA